MNDDVHAAHFAAGAKSETPSQDLAAVLPASFPAPAARLPHALAHPPAGGPPPVAPAPAKRPGLRRLTTPRAAALAGVVFTLLFGAVLILIRTNMPEGVQGSAQWLTSRRSAIATATVLMPFAGISFLWFIGAVRDGLALA